MQNQTRNLIIVALLALFVVATCWNQLPGQAPAAKPAVQKWEYKIIPLGATNQSPDALNEAGAEGWELSVTYPFGSDGNVMSVLRRPKAGK